MRKNGGLLPDMDGVIYRGSELIEDAAVFVRSLIEHDVPIRFLTNNSQRTRRDHATKLRRLGLPVEFHHVDSSHGRL